MQLLRDPQVRIAALGGLLWALGVAFALAATFARQGELVAVGLVASYAGDVLLHAGDPRIPQWFGERDLAAAHRAMLREAVAVFAWILIAAPSPSLVVLVVVAVLAVHAGHLGYRLITGQHAELRRGRLGWANLDVDGVTDGPVRLDPILPSIGPVRGRRVLLLSDVPIVVGLAVGWSGGGPWPVVVGAAATVVLVLGCVALAQRRSTLVRRLPTAATENARLREAVERLAPEVVVYFSGPVGTTYQLNVWLETLARLRRPPLLLIRERHHLDDLGATELPIVIAPSATNVEFIHTDSVLVALYPTTVIRNNHMIRTPGIRHVFINHGDGDKAVTFSPLHRVFDEIWVAGQAACDRYLLRGEGVREDQLVVVGRPQLAHIEPPRPLDLTRPVTVLYAPTWEGNFDNVDYSSVARMGERLVDALLRMQPTVRLLVKMHPATGNRSPAAAGARTAIEARVRASANGEVVDSSPDALYRAFNEADVLVADVSSVVADFLASRKPYVMTNPRDVPVDVLHREFPSTSGAAVVGGDGTGVVEAVRSATGPDPLAQRRDALATYFLGQPVADPVERFAVEVDAACVRARSRHERAHAGDRSAS
jgi:hypothetical protein